MRVTIPDPVLDWYQALADKRRRRIETVVTAQLDRWSGIPPGDRAVALTGPMLERAEAATGGLPFRDAEHAIARIEDLASVTFHNVRLDFSPQQLRELEHRAERQGKPVEVLAAEMIQTITAEFFWGIPPGAATETNEHPDARP